MIRVFEFSIHPGMDFDAAIRIEGNTLRSMPVERPIPDKSYDAETEITDQEIDEIRTVLEEVGFKDWKRDYWEEGIMDGTSYRIRAGRKVVRVYHEGPEGLDHVIDVFSKAMRRVGAESWE